MPHYDVSSHLRTIANIWDRWGAEDADNRYLLDGDDDKASAHYAAAEQLAKAMQDMALPHSVELFPGTMAGDLEGMHVHPVLGLMALMVNDPGAEERFLPVPEFCERYGLDARMVELESDDSPTADACRTLIEQGVAETDVLRSWRPVAEADEEMIVKQISEDGPYAIFARERVAEPEAA